MIDSKQQNTVQVFDVVILGAGLSGVLTALELPSSLNIALIDIGDEIIHRRSTSYNQCNKLHLGLHYAGNNETAMKCLESSIHFASKYKSYILGKPQDPWRKGRHFIMSNSRFDVPTIQSVCENLANMYRAEAKKCQFVFGNPDDFFRYLKSDEYPEISKNITSHDVNGVLLNSTIELGIETSESQININYFKRELSQKIKTSENIIFVPNHQIKKISFDAQKLTYNILTKYSKSSEEITFYGKAVINSTWQNIESLDCHIDQNPKEDDEIIIRIKSSLLVKLPSSLQRLNTCIFSIGPFCSFTNLGNGTAIVTEETASNLAHYPARGKVNSEIHSLVNAVSRLNHPLRNKISRDILYKSSFYIPALAHATILDLQVGYVKIAARKKDYSIYSAESPIHARIENGIEQKALGYISAAGMKMTYTYSNAVIINELLHEHLILRKALVAILERIPRSREKNIYLNISQQGQFIKLFKDYLSYQTGISSSHLSQILPSWQLASIIHQFPAIMQNHAILSSRLLYAA